MDVSGTQMVSPIQKPDEQLLAVRINQRITAEVVQVAGDQVTLSMNGVKVIARLTSADQSAALIEQKVAHFIVRDASSPILTLQLIRPAPLGAAPTTLPSGELAQRILAGMGIPINQNTVAIARSLISQGLMVTPETVQEMQDTLEKTKGWGDKEANLAAWIKAQGLPLSPGSLALALSYRNGPSTTETMVAIQTRLQALLSGQAGGQLQELAGQFLKLLDGIMVRHNATPEDIGEALKQITRLFGGSLEKDLANQLDPQKARAAGAEKSSESLNLLIRLRSEAARQGETGLVQQIDRFLDTVRWVQFTNVEPQDALTRGQWLNLRLPSEINPQERSPQGSYREANLRISCRTEGEKVRADSGYTRLVIQMDMKHGETITVDLSIVRSQVGAEVTTSSEDLRDLAENELGQFQQSIEALGYMLKKSSCTVGSLPQAQSGPPQFNAGIPDQSIDLDV